MTGAGAGPGEKKTAPAGRRPNCSVAAGHTEKPSPIPVDASSGLRKLAGTRLDDLKSPGPEPGPGLDNLN